MELFGDIVAWPKHEYPPPSTCLEPKRRADLTPTYEIIGRVPLAPRCIDDTKKTPLYSGKAHLQVDRGVAQRFDYIAQNLSP